MMTEHMQIAGELTVSDWRKLSSTLHADMSNEHLWEKAFGYFEQRMNARYLNPIRLIESASNIEGEGFSITAIACSLMEALESFYQGRSYRKGTTKNPLNESIEYYRSQPMFESFLQNREPFKSNFSSAGLATDFYKNVRCAILHEAATRNGWRIRIDTNRLIEKNENEIVLNRVLLVQAIEEYINNYKKELLSSTNLKEAFIRKFDAICASA